MCFLSVLPWVYPVWDSLGFLDMCDYFLLHFREVFSYYLLEYFLSLSCYLMLAPSDCHQGIQAWSLP